MPSAMVGPSLTVVIMPLRNDTNMEGTVAAWTPMTLTFGRMDFTAVAIPLISPPPPMGTMICSTSGTTDH